MDAGSHRCCFAFFLDIVAAISDEGPGMAIGHYVGPEAIEPAYPRSPLTARKAYGFHERQTVVALGTRPRFTRCNSI
jgi:hypothetical protein